MDMDTDTDTDTDTDMEPLLDTLTHVPKLVIFDLDYTLWPFWVDSFPQPIQFQKDSSGKVIDYRGREVKPYCDSHNILLFLQSHNITCGVASRTEEKVAAEQLITLFGWDKFFKYKEMFFVDSKISHFDNIRTKSEIDLEDMLFFDDEPRNIYEVQRFGVVAYLVEDGITMRNFIEGMIKFSDKKTEYLASMEKNM